jgi:hypothetical protein
MNENVKKMNEKVGELEKEKQCHVSESYTEVGHKVLEGLEIQKQSTEYEGEDGLPSIMSDKDINAMKSLAVMVWCSASIIPPLLMVLLLM